MNKNDILYGLKEWEHLEDSLDEAVDRIIEEAVVSPGEGFGQIADRMAWPLEILVYKRMDVGGEKMAIMNADKATNLALENLDEEYGDMDGDYTEPTEVMKEAALVFGKAIVADYVPWTCEPTGEIIEYTREQAQDKEDICL